MIHLSKGWRRKCGIATLLAALVLTGAWIKSAVDRVATRHSTIDPAGALSQAGKITVFGLRNPIESNGSGQQSIWLVWGLYADAKINIAPGPVSSGLPGPVPDAENRLPEAALPSVAAELSPPPADSHPEEATDDAAAVKTRWRCCGFSFERTEAADGSYGTMVLVPHWLIITPLLLLSAAWLIRPHGTRAVNGLAPGSEVHPHGGSGPKTTPTLAASPPWPMLPASAPLGSVTSQSIDALAASGRSHGIAMEEVTAGSCKARRGRWGFVTALWSLALREGWRGKLALVTLLSSLVLTGGWVRSFAVTDLVNFELGTQAQVSLVSGNDGLSCRYEPSVGGPGFCYGTFTGRDHEVMTFRPKGDAEMIEDLGISEPLEADAAELEDNPDEPQLLTLTSGEADATTNAQTLVSAPAGISSAVDWIGTSLEWGGLYISHGPMDTTVVVPYGLLVIPLTFLFAGLLAWPRISLRPPCQPSGRERARPAA